MQSDLSQLNHTQRYLIEEFAGDYLDHKLSRRVLLKRVVLLTGSLPLTASVLLAMGCGSSSKTDESAIATATPAPAAAAPTAQPAVAGTPTGPGVAVNDPAIVAQDVSFQGQASMIRAYVARPSSSGPHPAVLIIHENQGLLDHFKDVARRFAKEGFVGLAIDLLSRVGGTTGDSNTDMAAFRVITSDDFVADMKSGLDYLKAQSYVAKGGSSSLLGVMGFCFGGNETWDLAVTAPEMKAAVPLYGTVRLIDQLGQVNAACLAMYGALDTRVTSTSADVEQRLKAANKTIEVKIYDNANHAFFNDTKPASYNAAAATAAWADALAWFRKYLVA